MRDRWKRFLFWLLKPVLDVERQRMRTEMVNVYFISKGLLKQMDTMSERMNILSSRLDAFVDKADQEEGADE